MVNELDVGISSDRRECRSIAFVSTMAGTAWGGSEELWSGAALYLSKLGHHVSASVYDWPQRHPRLGELNKLGAELHFRPRHPSLADRVIAKGLKHIRRGAISHSALSWLKRCSPDLVVISQGYVWDGVPWMEACQERGLTYCPIVHANSEIWWPSDDQLPSISRTYSQAREIYFVSHANHRLMELQCGKHFQQAQVIVNPWKVDARDPVPWPDNSHWFDVACVGRLDPRAKGQDLLIEVMAQEKWRERPVRLNLYGSGSYGKSLQAMVDLFGLTNVSFKGEEADIRTIWTENHALILPSRYEGLPLVIIEAMLCGRMVITTEIAGNSEYIIDGEHGFIADAPTCKSLDATMERAWSRRADWALMGIQARAHAMKEIPPNPIEIFSRKLLDVITRDQPVSRTNRRYLKRIL
jgi:glycosyltransferase involved in cell wall biosynthesis